MIKNFNEKVMAELLITIMGSLATVERLLNTSESFNNIAPEKKDIVVSEFMFYYLHVCDRLLFENYEEQTTAAIMNGIVDKIASVIDRVKDGVMDEQLAEMDISNFGKFFKNLRETKDSQWFMNKYRQKQIEYQQYNFLPENDDINNSVDWHFAKSTVSLIAVDKDFVRTAELKVLGMCFYREMFALIERVNRGVFKFCP